MVEHRDHDDRDDNSSSASTAIAALACRLRVLAESFRAAIGYLRQNAGVNRISKLKISSRPSSIASEHTQVWKSVSTW